MSFNKEYENIFNSVNGEIEIIKKNIIKNIGVKEPLNTEFLGLLNAKSKHIRSVMSIIYLKSKNLQITRAHIELLSAVELIHSASLIHDDVIDEGKVRRNIETLNSKFSSKLAVISGDYLLSKALQIINNLKSFEIIKSFAKTLEDMCNGEISQYFNRFKITTIDEYIEKSQNKTAELFVTALNSCLILSGIEDNNAEIFAKNFGTAFQIRDDLINITQRSNTNPNDIKEGIYTAPVIFAGDKDKVKDGIEKTYLLINNYIDRALNALNGIENNEYKGILVNLTEILKDE